MGHQKSLGNFCFRGFFDIHFTTELPPAPKGADVRALRKGNALGEFRARVGSESPMGHQKSLGNFSPLFLTENLRTQKIGRGLFSLPICVIMGLTKSLSLWERWRRSRRRGLDYGMKRPLTRYAGALPKGEPLDACNLRGMGFARSRRLLQRCNTRAKLAIKQNDK